jgi:hypothetical protein
MAREMSERAWGRFCRLARLTVALAAANVVLLALRLCVGWLGG